MVLYVENGIIGESEAMRSERATTQSERCGLDLKAMIQNEPDHGCHCNRILADLPKSNSAPNAKLARCWP